MAASHRTKVHRHARCSIGRLARFFGPSWLHVQQQQPAAAGAGDDGRAAARLHGGLPERIGAAVLIG
jgi:hypothetical protein